MAPPLKRSRRLQELQELQESPPTLTVTSDTTTAATRYQVASKTSRREVAAFPFQKLPGELRNMIYAVVSPKRKILKWTKPRIGPNNWNGIFALAKTCRQLRMEVMSFYYGSIDLQVSYWYATGMIRWVRQMPKQYITRVTICPVMTYSQGTFTAWEKILRSLAYRGEAIQVLTIRDDYYFFHEKISWTDCESTAQRILQNTSPYPYWPYGLQGDSYEQRVTRVEEFFVVNLIELLKKFKGLRVVKISSSTRDQPWMDMMSKAANFDVEYVGAPDSTTWRNDHLWPSYDDSELED
ncbi:hypothetical protein B0H67DRAFT_556068 [Lasiosphaeris hirsuta]|uniref:Uncharacterized protein n=1 Tax=Lasiosphaeris hirsuta TaxID=260670 RepID=A0AA40DKT3_9PEZI|nr:hypothetical protein B0H67DRAFT_556068 [Lasiosphaeris hirsuta]